MTESTFVAGQRLFLTAHAVERYCQRFKHLNDPTKHELNRFARELSLLCSQFGSISDDMPWSSDHIPEEDSELVNKTVFYINIGDDICIPAEYSGSTIVGVTVLARGSISSIRRTKRNTAKRERRARQAARRQTEAWRGERAQRWK